MFGDAARLAPPARLRVGHSGSKQTAVFGEDIFSG